MIIRSLWAAVYWLLMLITLPFLVVNIVLGQAAAFCYKRTFEPESPPNGKVIPRDVD